MEYRQHDPCGPKAIGNPPVGVSIYGRGPHTHTHRGTGIPETSLRSGPVHT